MSVKGYCMECGEHLKTKHQTKFCSVACRQKNWSGDGNPNWRGGKVKRAGRLAIYSPGHPDASDGRYVFEYRLVAAKKIGRGLLPTEVVHHINGNPDDNRPENLQVMTLAEHARLEFYMRERDPKTMRLL